MKFTTSLSMIATAGLTAAAAADITGAYVVSYSVTAADFDGSDVTVNVQDLYLSSDDNADTVLNVFNMNVVDAGQVNYFQSFTGTGGWCFVDFNGFEILRFFKKDGSHVLCLL